MSLPALLFYVPSYPSLLMFLPALLFLCPFPPFSSCVPSRPSSSSPERPSHTTAVLSQGRSSVVSSCARLTKAQQGVTPVCTQPRQTQYRVLPTRARSLRIHCVCVAFLSINIVRRLFLHFISFLNILFFIFVYFSSSFSSCSLSSSFYTSSFSPSLLPFSRIFSSLPPPLPPPIFFSCQSTKTHDPGRLKG